MGKSGFAFDGSGRLDRIETFTTKAGKDIVTLILQVEGSYPQLVPIKFFGRMADLAKEIAIGDVVEVTGHLGGREWNGKVYGDIVGETIEVVAGRAANRSAQAEGGGGFSQVPGRDADAGSQVLPEDDDIPF